MWVEGLILQVSKILAFCLMLLVCGTLCFSQEAEDADATVDSATIQKQATEQDDSASYFGTDSPAQTGTEYKSPSGVLVFFKMIFVLAVVLACVYAVFFFVRKNIPSLNTDDVFLRRVASISLTPGKSVQVVTLTDEQAFVVGVSDQNVSLLGTVNNKELITAMNLNHDRTSQQTKPKNFNDVLSIFLKKPVEQSVFESTAKQAQDMFERQRQNSTEENAPNDSGDTNE